MPLLSKNGIRYFVFENLSEQGVIHAIFARHGGVSPAPWHSLNVGGMVGDTPANVLQNKMMSFDVFGLDVQSSYEVWQIHSNRVVFANSPKKVDEPYIKADGILTKKENVTLFMRFADCVPIMMYDLVSKAVGLVHAGWRGTVDNIVTEAVKKMMEGFGSDPKNLIVGIGPSIGPEKYIIGGDVKRKFETTFGEEANLFIHTKDHEIKLDLWKANEYLLRKAGVKQIEVASICTASNTNDWYSHRAENGKTGRFGALIRMPFW